MNGYELLAVAAVIGAGAWAAELWVNPWAKCMGCDGKGRHWLSRAGAWGDCRLCGGSGKRLRVGARWVRPRLRKGGK